jgi:hypothetical protein
MTEQANQLYQRAMLLTEAERGELAARLLESLDPTTEADADAAWDKEIQDRLIELDSGAVSTIPWTDARRMIMDDTDDSLSS